MARGCPQSILSLNLCQVCLASQLQAHPCSQWTGCSFNGPREHFLIFSYLSNSPWRNRLCVVTGGNCPRLSCVRHKQKSLAMGLGLPGGERDSVRLSLLHCPSCCGLLFKSRILSLMDWQHGARGTSSVLSHATLWGNVSETGPALLASWPSALNLTSPFRKRHQPSPASSSANCSSLWKHTTLGLPWRTPPSSVTAFQQSTSASGRHSCIPLRETLDGWKILVDLTKLSGYQFSQHRTMKPRPFPYLLGRVWYHFSCAAEALWVSCPPITEQGPTVASPVTGRGPQSWRWDFCRQDGRIHRKSNGSNNTQHRWRRQSLSPNCK